MAKEMEAGYRLEDENSIGEVRIADDVVANIAAIAATEVEGVANINGNLTNEKMRRAGVKNGKGVKVDLNEEIVNVELALVLEYNYNIPATCKKVQDRVKTSIENMTGLTVADINIRIIGVDMTKQA